MDSVETGWHVCSGCGEVLDTHSELLAHICTPETIDESIENEAQTSMQTSGHSCSICSMGFDEKEDLFAHFVEVHSIDTVFQCSQCAQISFDRNALNDHLTNFHNQSLSQSVVSEVVNGDSDDFRCQMCSRDFKTLTAFRRHQAWHAGPQVCPNCQKTFRSPMNLRWHKCQADVNRSNRENFKCPKCAKTFSFQSYLDRHMTTHSIAPISCSLCNLIFTVESAYIKHYRSVHNSVSGGLKFRCVECDRSFGYQSQLDRHGIVHSKEKNFECPWCQQRFSLPHGLSTHQRRIHPDKKIPSRAVDLAVPKLRFSCAFCPARFPHESLMERHHHAAHPHLLPPINPEILSALIGPNQQLKKTEEN